MTRFWLFWHRCDWCGNISMFPLAWIKKENKEYCTGACAEHQTFRIAGVKLENKF